MTSGSNKETPLLLALDLGTTSLTGRLFTTDGLIRAERQILNPQAVFGVDVLRRLEASRAGHGAKLQTLLTAGINELSSDLLLRSAPQSGSIRAVAAAANPAISILLQNRPSAPILCPPYHPQSCAAVNIMADSLGLNLPVPFYLFPLVNGFVGGDLIAFLYGQGEPSVSTLYVDIGTNGEIALYHNGRWLVTSVAAGPAFEGGDIGAGMLHGPGAIQSVWSEGDRFVFDVVDDLPPRGLCGSGLAEMIAAALDSGLINRQGSIVDSGRVETNLAQYICTDLEGPALQLYRDAQNRILLEQKDIRNFQLAKAAVHAGVECLLARAEVTVNQIEEVILTGAFGFSLSPKTLKRVAMLPGNMVEKVRFVPGGALKGVSQMLLTEDGSAQVEKLAASLKPYPLSGTPAFEKAFLKAIDF